MIDGAAASIRANMPRFASQLDCVAGDGDHGATMLRVVDQLEKTFAPGGPEDLKTCLRDAGWSVLGVDGGASSSLLGIFFGGMADATECEAPLSASELAAIFEAGPRGRSEADQSPARRQNHDGRAGAGSRDAARGRGRRQECGGSAARCGATPRAREPKRQEIFTARYGRAKLLGEKTLGHEDPGAVSVSLMFEGFYSGFRGIERRIRQCLILMTFRMARTTTSAFRCRRTHFS